MPSSGPGLERAAVRRRTRLGASALVPVLAIAIGLTWPTSSSAAIGEDDTSPFEADVSSEGYLTDSVMVRFRGGFLASSERAAFAHTAGLSETMFTPLSHYFQFRIIDGKSVDAKLNALRRNPHVEVAERIGLGAVDFDPDDPLYNSQWYLTKTKVPQAWDLAGGGTKSYAAVVDSGVDVDHPDLGIIAGKNFVAGESSTYIDDDFGHGTWVAGIQAAFTDNTKGIAGINHSAPILAVRVFATGSGTKGPNVVATTAGIEYAVQRGASAINVSHGFYGLTEAQIEPLRLAVKSAWDANRPVVASAGNYDISFYGRYPQSFLKAITVTATTSSDTRAGFSNFGDASVPIYPNLAAPGVDMCTTARGGGYTCTIDGTSFSAPMVTGVIALIKKANSGLTSQQIVNRLQNSAAKVGAHAYSGSYCGGLNIYMGCGRMNAKAAVD